MKLKTFILLGIIVIGTIFSACSPPPSEKYYQPMNTIFIYQDNDSKLYFSYADGDYPIRPNNIISSKPRSLYLFNHETKLWEKIAVKNNGNITVLSEDYNSTKIEFLYRTLTTSMMSDNMVSTQESIAYEGNVVKLTDIDTNKVVLSDTLPTKEEIRDATGIDLYNSNIKYHPLMEGQFYWDKESHIATACVNQTHDKYGTRMCDEVYAFSLLKDQNSSWNIENIVEYNTISVDDKKVFFNLYNDIILIRDILSGTSNLVSDNGLFVKTENGVVLKKIFSETYPQEYIDLIFNMYSSNVNKAFNWTFDEQGNMHLFYNKKEDIKNENYDYFWYGYFTKENPTTPLYEQKIPWK